MSSQPQTLQCIEKVDSDAVICNCKSLQKGPCFFTQQNVPRPIYIWQNFFSMSPVVRLINVTHLSHKRGRCWYVCGCHWCWAPYMMGTIHDGHTDNHTSMHIQHTLHLTLQSASGCLQSEYLFSVLFAWCGIQLQYFSHDYAHIHSLLCVCSTVGRPIPNPWCTDAHGSCSCAALLQ